MDSWFVYILAIVNRDAMNIEVHISFFKLVFPFLCIYNQYGIAGSYGNSIFSFLETLILFSIMLHQFIVSLIVYNCPSTTSLSTFIYRLFITDILTGVR